MDNIIEVTITFLECDNGVVIPWGNVLVLRKHGLTCLGVKCHAVCKFGMNHKIKMA